MYMHMYTQMYMYKYIYAYMFSGPSAQGVSDPNSQPQLRGCWVARPRLS